MSLLPHPGGLCCDSVAMSRGPFRLLICHRQFEQGWVCFTPSRAAPTPVSVEVFPGSSARLMIAPKRKLAGITLLGIFPIPHSHASVNY